MDLFSSWAAETLSGPLLFWLKLPRAVMDRLFGLELLERNELERFHLV